MDPASSMIAQWGGFGAILIALGVYTLHLHKELKRVQEARVEDAKKVTETLMSLAKEWQTLLERLSNTVDKIEKPRR